MPIGVLRQADAVPHGPHEAKRARPQKPVGVGERVRVRQLARYGLYFVQGGVLSDGGDEQDDSGAWVATNGTMTEDKPSAAITGMNGLYRVDVDQFDGDMMKLA